jgi:hypothetical protein
MRPPLLIVAGLALLVVGQAAPAAAPALVDDSVPATRGMAVEPEPVWRAPLEPLVLRRPFDRPAQDWLAGHRGLDLAGRVGDPVRAVAPGTVTWAGAVAGRGVVTVSHGDLRSTYEPVTAAVQVGRQVSAGTLLGRLADGGHCAGCLHLGAVTAGGYRDPWPLLAPQIRLLPTSGGPSAWRRVNRRLSAAVSPTPAAGTGSRCRSACSRGP